MKKLNKAECAAEGGKWKKDECVDDDGETFFGKLFNKPKPKETKKNNTEQKVDKNNNLSNGGG